MPRRRWLPLLWISQQIQGRGIEYCRDGLLDKTKRYCCPSRCATCGETECVSSRDVCCRKRRERCRSIGATDCAVPAGVGTKDEELLYKEGCRRCVAVLLTGHLRTYERTAPSLKLLVREDYEFDLVVATYKTQDAKQPRFRDKTKHSTDPEQRVSSDDVLRAYTQNWQAVWVHIFDEDEIGAILPRDIRRHAPHLKVNDDHLVQVNRVKRSLALVQQGIWMVQDLAVKRKVPHTLVVRLRPDIQLLRPFPLDDAVAIASSSVLAASQRRLQESFPGRRRRNVVIVPTTYDPRGGLNIRAAQLTTRPCARNASLTPTWVQDHVAVAAFRPMLTYANFYHAYLKKGIFSGHVETSLAKYLKPLLRVSCLDSIQYTVVR